MTFPISKLKNMKLFFQHQELTSIIDNFLTMIYRLVFVLIMITSLIIDDGNLVSNWYSGVCKNSKSWRIPWLIKHGRRDSRIWTSPIWDACSISGNMIQESASAWWTQIKETRLRAEKSRIDTWERLKKYMRRFFLRYNYEQILYIKLHNICQGSRTVDEYASN